MKRLFLFLACIALLLPVTLAHLPARAQDGRGALPPVALGLDAIAPENLRPLDRARQSGEQHQVRIERRVIVRIAPRASSGRQNLVADLPVRQRGEDVREVPHADCVPLSEIAGAQPGGDNRLIIYTRKREVLSAELERKCDADAFYSGFYVERSEDGKICAGRDDLLSRAGASCGVRGFTKLVVDAD